MSIVDADVGQALSPLVKPPITLEQLRRYAEASGDHNPIHVDQEAARRVGLDSVIAHGMLSMAFLGQFVSQQIAGIADAQLAHLKVRFVNMVRLDDTLTCLGIVTAHTSNGELDVITLECWAQNQKGDKVTTGEAVVFVPSPQRNEVSA
ncbi:MAG TPA: MaoC/PaaZ C-terminal domain-containing protein [Ktedonobacteraceae bacterium]